jgi:DNA-binding FadR family transcriptional regulator
MAGSLAERRELGSKHAGELLIAASGNRVLVMLGDLIAALLPPFAAQPSADGTDPSLESANRAAGLLEWLRTVELPSLLSRLGGHPSERRITPPRIPQSTCFQSEAMQLVHELMSTTAPEAWMRGELIGNEFDLADRFGVDKSIVRQAIRLMEDAEVARALPGRGRGLVTRLPSTAPLSRLLCAYIVAHGGTAADGEALFRVLRMECVGAAADHATSSDKASLLAMLQDLENLTAPLPVSALQGFERLQQHVARNCLLGLSIDAVKAFLTWQMGTCPIASAEILAVYREHTRRVVTAICAGNRAKAVEAESEKLIAMSRLRDR